MPTDPKNLVYLVWETIICQSTYTRLVEACPYGVEIDLEKGTWSFTKAQKDDPAKDKTYMIGSREFRDVVSFALRTGPITVADRTNIEHLNNLIAVAEEMATDEAKRGARIRLATT